MMTDPMTGDGCVAENYAEKTCHTCHPPHKIKKTCHRQLVTGDRCDRFLCSTYTRAHKSAMSRSRASVTRQVAG